jgi:nucleoside phosphorylase
MSIAAARSFIAAVKRQRDLLDDKAGQFYKKFIVAKETPTEADLKALKAVIKEMEDIAKVYHTDVHRAMAGFGGSGDTTIQTNKIMYNTLKAKVKK